MAKTASDIAPPESLAAPNTMSILKVASQSAKPPVAKSKTTGGTAAEQEALGPTQGMLIVPTDHRVSAPYIVPIIRIANA